MAFGEEIQPLLSGCVSIGFLIPIKIPFSGALASSLPRKATPTMLQHVFLVMGGRGVSSASALLLFTQQERMR